MSEAKPWSPKLDTSKEYRDHANPALGDDAPLEVPLDTQDTAPLQGSRDLSDEDSLEDVVAESFEPEPQAPGTVAVPPEKFRP